MVNKQIEALRLALEALERCDAALAEELAAWDIDPPLHHVLEASNACGPAITAIREALAEQPAQHDYRIKYDRPCYKCRSNFCPGSCKEPEQPAQQQEPEAQCTASDAWNCKYCRKNKSCDALEDSRNFASPPASKPLTDEQIDELARATFDVVQEMPDYQVNGDTWDREFARAIEAKLREKNACT